VRELYCEGVCFGCFFFFCFRQEFVGAVKGSRPHKQHPDSAAFEKAAHALEQELELVERGKTTNKDSFENDKQQHTENR
jgi:hypothetical protein